MILLEMAFHLENAKAPDVAKSGANRDRSTVMLYTPCPLDAMIRGLVVVAIVIFQVNY